VPTAANSNMPQIGGGGWVSSAVNTAANIGARWVIPARPPHDVSSASAGRVASALNGEVS